MFQVFLGQNILNDKRISTSYSTRADAAEDVPYVAGKMAITAAMCFAYK